MGHHLCQRLVLDRHAAAAQPRYLRHAPPAGSPVYGRYPVNLCAPTLFKRRQRKHRFRHHPEGSSKSLGDYAGKVLLIVNVASRCGHKRRRSAGPQRGLCRQGPGGSGVPLQRLRRPGARQPRRNQELLLQHLRRRLRTVRQGARQGLQSPTPPSIRWIPQVMWSGTSRSSWWGRTER